MKKRQNRLKEVLEKELEKRNVGVKPRDKKCTIKDLLKELAKSLDTSFFTTWNWYQNTTQPRGENDIMVPEYYNIKPGNFYYYIEIEVK